MGFANAGMRNAVRGLKFAMAWGIATAELGREPENIEEYADVLEESRATAFRDQQAFRKAFPTEVSPARMNEVSGMQKRYEELVRTLRNSKRASLQAQPLMYSLGAAPAD